jgi:LysM repeat protein
MAWSAGKNPGNNKLLYVAAGLGLLLVLLIALSPGENSGIGQLLSAAAPDSSSFTADSSLSPPPQQEKAYEEFPERATKDSAVVLQNPTPAPDSAQSSAPAETPAVAATPVTDAGGTVLSYRIKKGDTFFKIAAMFGNKPAEMQELNGMEDMNLQADKDMKVKIKAMHTAEQGEGLNAIASRYGVSARSIKIANGLSSDNVPSGTSLIIPLK